MSQAIRQMQAKAAYRALLNKREEDRRQARLNQIRDRLVRRFVTDRNGWLFAAAVMGAALAAVSIRLFH